MRIFNEIVQASERIRAEFPDVEVVEIGQGLPDGVGADVLFGGWGPHSPEAVSTRGIRWVQLSGTGFDGVRDGVLDAPIVTCARGASAVPISEYVLAAMLACEKDLPGNWLHERPKHWNFQRMDTLAGKTLGLVGIGGIGSRVARLAVAFEMDVVALRRHPDAGSPVPGVRVTADFGEVLDTADHLVLAAPATSRTRHLLDAGALARVKPGVHLVNIARGDLVDQDALRAALDDGRVVRASLDTVTPEPLPEGHWMYLHPKVFLTPHSSWSSPAFFDAAIAIFLDNLGRYRAGEPLLHVIDRDEGY